MLDGRDLSGGKGWNLNCKEEKEQEEEKGRGKGSEKVNERDGSRGDLFGRKRSIRIENKRGVVSLWKMQDLEQVW